MCCLPTKKLACAFFEEYKLRGKSVADSIKAVADDIIVIYNHASVPGKVTDQE